MSEIIILNFKDPRIQLGDYVAQMEDIFFEASTKKDFKDKDEKEAFRWKYLGFYLAHYPEYAWIALGGSKVLGYVLGMPFTQDPSLYQIQPHLKKFEAYFTDYPSHLHINMHEGSRGKGVGQKLAHKLFEQLKMEDVGGLHIMTGANSDNRHFYRKLGFTFEFEDAGVLLMGLKLRSHHAGNKL